MNTTLTNHAAANVTRLAHLPITLFSIVMGLAGVAIAWDRTEFLSAFSQPIGLAIATLSSAFFVFLLIAYGTKIIRHRSYVALELRHPIRINFFPTIAISFLLLSVYWRQNATATTSLWAVGALLQLLLTLYVMSSWIHHTHYEINHINPGWFIPVVGNIIVPITGTYLGYTEVSWFFFSIGIVFWLIMFTVVMYRLIFHDPIPAKITPMLFILLAPPSIGFVSYTLLIDGLDNFARILFYTAIFIGLLLASNTVRYFKLPFFISSWAYSFPLAALAIATTRFSALNESAIFNGISFGILLLLSTLVVWLALNTIKAAKHHEICVPE